MREGQGLRPKNRVMDQSISHLVESGHIIGSISDDDEEQEWEVEAIVDHRQDGRNKERQYLIKWKAWPEDHNTWLPAFPNLENSKELLKSYDRNHGLESETTFQRPLKVKKNSEPPRRRPLKRKRGPGRPRKGPER